MKLTNLKIWIWIAVMCLFAMPVFAQDAGLPDGGTLPLQDDPAKLAQFIINAVASKQWWVVVSAAVLLMTWAIRTYGSKLSPKVEAVLQHPVVSWSMPSVLSLIGAVVATLVAGQPLNATALIGEAVKIAFGAIAMYVGAKKIVEARVAGQEAAAAVKTKEDAIAVLTKKDEPKP